MKKTAVGLSVFIILSLGASLSAQTRPDEKLFQDAKLLIFDKKWEDARIKLEELLDKYPSSVWAGQAVFYKAECLGASRGREREALEAYRDYLRSPDRNPSLLEESEGSIIDLAYSLFGRGDKGIIREIESRLDHANKVVRYYAAYKLSLVPDKKIALKAVPVLERILKSEKDPELQDRARIALLRVSPSSLDVQEERRPTSGSGRVLKIRVWTKGEKAPDVSLNIPWALADLTLSAILDDQQEAIRKRGYDIDKIMKTVVESREILRIESDDSIIEIWIE